MEHLTVDSFLPLVNGRFHVAAGATALELLLVEAAARERGGTGQRAPFALLFKGPLTPVLPQGTYRFQHSAIGDLDLFIVPVGPAGGGMQYEAIFN